MDVIVQVYTDFIIEMTRNYFNKNKITCNCATNEEEIISILSRCGKCLLVLEADKSIMEFKNLLIKAKATNRLCEIIGLFHSDYYESIPLFVNSKLVDGIGFIPMSDNDFENLVNTYVNPKKITNQLMENILDKDYVIKDILSMEYIYDLIYGNTSRINTLREISTLMGLEKVPQLALTLMCDDFWNKCENLNNRERYNIKRKILNTVRNAIENKCRGVASTLVGTDKIVVLIDCYPMEERNAENFATEIAKGIKEYVKERTSYTVTIGISRFYKDYRQLWKAYEESFRALTYSFIRGDDSIIRYDDTKSADNMDYQKYLNQFEQNLIRGISSGNNGGLEVSFEDICKFLILNNYNPEVIKSIIIKILFAVVQYCYNIGVDFNLLSKEMIVLMVEILKTNSFKKIEDMGERFLESVACEVKELNNRDKNTVMNAASAYINKYYFTNITLEELADVCGLSHFHFSRVFKKHYGVSFIQYLINIRIENAKRMLLESNETVEVIAERVGFREVGYFSRTFKRVIGMSPSQFRKNRK